MHPKTHEAHSHVADGHSQSIRVVVDIDCTFADNRCAGNNCTLTDNPCVLVDYDCTLTDNPFARTGGALPVWWFDTQVTLGKEQATRMRKY